MLDNELDELLNDTPAPHKADDGHKRKSLGRGLGALLGDDSEDEISLDSPLAKATSSVNIHSIVAGKYQPRTEFEPEALQALSDSIKEKGVLQPLLVRKSGDVYESLSQNR